MNKVFKCREPITHKDIMEKKFLIDQKILLSLLASIQPICTKRTTIDSTSCILFQVGHRELILKSTDLEISLQTSCELTESTIIGTEIFLVSGRRIFDIIKELEGTITCILAHNQLVLQAGKVNLSLNIKNAEEFPPFPERIENLMQLNADSLLTMLESVAFLIPQNNSNSALNGLLLEVASDGFTMTTTDGHCLAQTTSVQTTPTQNKTWLLPRRAVFELKKILESSQDKIVFIGTCGNQLVFSGHLFNFFTKLLADKFPAYRPILEKTSFAAATIDRHSLLKTLKRSSCLLSGQFLATKFGFSPHTLCVSMHNKEVGKLDEELPLTGLEEMSLEVRFYAPYLLNGLQAFSNDTIKFFLKNSQKPIIFEAQSDHISMLYLVMPVSSQQQ
jgi:DNA polymerase III subunit beta